MRLSLALALMLLTVSLLTVSPDLLAQTRVFVSRSGSDHNSCSIVTPCRTFQRAHDVVADNGEIVPLNSAGYGPVVISKSVSITAPDGVYVGITPPDGHGVHVLGEGIVVYLKGLTIHGNWAPESVGIYMERGARLVVDRCRVSHFDAGISVQTGTHQPVLVVQDCVLDENRDSGIVSLNPLSTVTILRCTVTGGRNGLLNYGGAWNIQDTLVKGVTSSGLLGSTAAG
ncbi:MAG: right-handed parallel beta-helix repeat-containing protein [Acidobacteria bacterium]|nr:MAG: right-handed parallel beta-helix repeat-containing protein [Acidobacteriota bacterium]